jgi:hypothetical protein
LTPLCEILMNELLVGWGTGKSSVLAKDLGLQRS